MRVHVHMRLRYELTSQEGDLLVCLWPWRPSPGVCGCVRPHSCVRLSLVTFLTAPFLSTKATTPGVVCLHGRAAWTVALGGCFQEKFFFRYTWHPGGLCSLEMRVLVTVGLSVRVVLGEFLF